MIELQKLNYDLGDLEPVIDKETVEIHHLKHHQAYVNNLNGLIKGTDLENANLEKILLSINEVKENKAGINNNAGGVYMHNVYFGQFAKDTSKCEGELLSKIEEKFNSFDEMISIFKEKALKQFGSGWSVLVVDKENNLDVVSIANQDVSELLLKGLTPIATLDVWEHAYYLKYQNRRAEYLDEVVSIIDWKIVSLRYEELKK